ncbi:hypothetical protein AVEN_249083-1 [Araneus ventricosus]|uniref:Uncharacterized protein n=1 Tax=Araneus ventricosus TaxID=182803 RepID=A0A4Y2KYP1_ARAVE|nr:hypothetical protein AVEN_249083-1 [Araneus ventricosus]
MAMNSEQGHIGERLIGGQNNQARRNKQSTNDCNMAMRAFFSNGEMSSNFHRLTSMACQLGLGEDNLNIPSMPNSSNNKTDFSLERGPIDGMPAYKFPKLDVFEDIQSEPKIQNDPSKFVTVLLLLLNDRKHSVTLPHRARRSGVV